MTASNVNIANETPNVIQFENYNEGRSYPFEDNTVLRDADGRELSDDVIADMHLVIPTGSSAFLSSVRLTDNLVSACVQIRRENDGTVFAALSVIVRCSDLVPYIPYRMDKLVGSEDVGGIITFGNLDETESSGSYVFPDGEVRLAESTMSKYVPAGVRRFIDPRTGESVSGDVEFTFPASVTATDTDDGTRLEMGEEDLRSLLPECDLKRPENACGATPIETLNGVRADSKNRIVIWFH